MKVCINCNQNYEDTLFRCKTCVQVLISENWFNVPRETKTPIKILDIANIFSNEIASKSLAAIEKQLPIINAEIGKDTGKLALLVFRKYVENKILSENDVNNEIKNFTMFSLAWSSVCYIIGVENGKEKIRDDLVFGYITNVTDAFTNYFLAYIWNLYNQKLLPLNLYQEFISSFSSICFKSALYAEKNGYLESLKLPDINSKTIHLINQILLK